MIEIQAERQLTISREINFLYRKEEEYE